MSIMLSIYKCYFNILLVKIKYFSIIVVIVNFTYKITDAAESQIEKPNSLSLSPVPWIGVLQFQPEQKGEITVAGVILIHNKMAIVSARDLAKVHEFSWRNVSETSCVMFVSAQDEPWYADVVNYTIHPEFNEHTLNTIGILFLEYDDKYLQDNMLLWPSGFNEERYTGDEIFVFGYTDRTRALEQIVYRMDYVLFNNCLDFYIDEQLNSQWMRPASYHCYSVRFTQETCVFDPGMALVHHDQGNWTLLGISTWGPGCSLPARFLDFEHFAPWIVSHMPTRRQGTLRYKYAFADADTTGDLDTWVLNRLNDTTIALHKVVGQIKPEIVTGKCIASDKTDIQLIYKDRMNFTSRFKKVEALGVYGLSLFDLRYIHKKYTCIEVWAYCSEVSKPKLWYKKGFEQGHTMEPYVQISDKPYNRPHIHYLDQTWQQYKFKVLNSEITHLLFRFKYVGTAYIEVAFYGDKKPIFTTVKPTTTRTTPSPYNVVRSTIGYRTTTLFTTQRTTRHPPTTTNWWNRWWKYQGYAKIPGEEGGDMDWMHG